MAITPNPSRAVEDGDPRLDAIRGFRGNYPPQIWLLFLSEMWERFCFYGMRGVLTLFMIDRLGQTAAAANLNYGAIQAFVYTMTFVGGFFADKVLGFRRSIAWGGCLMAIGSFTVAAAPTQLFFVGTSISVVGTGFFKPNISGIVGLLYRDGDRRRNAGFSLFYSGINIGAALGGFLCVWLGKSFGWEWTFVAAGIAMILGVATFAFAGRTLGPLGHSPLVPEGSTSTPRARAKLLAVYAGSLLAIPLVLLLVSNSAYTDWFMALVGPLAVGYMIYEIRNCTRAEIRRLAAAMVFIVASVFFWAFFEQSGGSLAIVAENHVAAGSVLGMRLDAIEVNNTANSIFVILCSPLLGLLWLSLRKAEPDTTVKFGIGFLFLAAGFWAFSCLIDHVDAAGRASLALFTGAWFLSTVGELCLSPIGLSAMTSLAPKRMYGLIMGMWFLASAYGQYLAGLLGAGMANTASNASPQEKLQGYTDGYAQLAIYAVLLGALMLVVAPPMRRLLATRE